MYPWNYEIQLLSSYLSIAYNVQGIVLHTDDEWKAFVEFESNSVTAKLRSEDPVSFLSI